MNRLGISIRSVDRINYKFYKQLSKWDKENVNKIR